MLSLSDRVDGTWLMVLITMVNASTCFPLFGGYGAHRLEMHSRITNIIAILASMAWFGYDQGVFSGVLISSDFEKWFPETEDADISGITSSSFAVRVAG